MGRVTISQSKDHFMLDGKKFFYLADTAWSAFYNMTIEQWEEYLDFRKTQSFNAVQLFVTQAWDGGKPDLGINPFKLKKDGSFDFYNLNDEYFERAKKMLEIASKKGFIPSVLILHACYTKGTWATSDTPDIIRHDAGLSEEHRNWVNRDKSAWVMPYEVVKVYTERVVKDFAPYNPVYMVAGDTNFTSEDPYKYFMSALETTKATDPDALTCFHLATALELPEAFEKSKLLDFYMLQPGHGIEELPNTYKYTQHFYHKSAKRPIVMGEFNYEGYSYGHGHYGRYNEFDERRSMWQGILSGAKAGIGYGAHGMWGMYKRGKQFLNESHGGRAFPWQTALRFKGAWDMSFGKWIYENYDLFDIEPCDGILNENQKQKDEIRMAKSPDGKKILIYIPYSTYVNVSEDLSKYECLLINMSEKLFSKPLITVKKDHSVIEMYDFNTDALFIGIRK